SVSTYGDWAVVGAARDGDLAGTAGSAYFFKKDGSGTWVQQQKVYASNGASGNTFGWSVSMHGDYALIGSYGHNGNDSHNGSNGSAYIFKKDGTDTWVEHQILTASDGAAGDGFGINVFLNDEYAVIGAYFDDAAAGSAYVYKKDGTGFWVDEQKLIASDRTAGDSFGIWVAMSGDYALVGANFDDSGQGSAYVYKKDGAGTWNQHQKLLASDGAAGDNFGVCVSINGDQAIIGSVNENSGTGAAYIFKDDGAGNWVELQKLIASDGSSFDQFGLVVYIEDSMAIVSAYADDDNGGDSGSVYLFTKDGSGTWVEQQKIKPSDGSGGSYFGNYFSVYGDYLLVAAAYTSGSAGSAYFFKKDCVPIDLQTDASCKTVYLGYGSTCTELSASVMDGSGSLSYTWNPGNLSGESVEVCPTETTTYTVTVTNEFGCSESSQVTVEVIDIRCGNKGNKVQICHKGQVICVAPNAVGAHLAHGDNLGPCGFVPCQGSPGARIGVEALENPTLSGIEMSAYPNPGNSIITIRVENMQAGEASFEVVDLIGRPLIQKTKQMVEGTNDVTFDLQPLSNGIYLIRCRDAFMHQGVLRISKY
ncbi:MAG: T9SS type A sorting domain-containing protein, partial [Bacteroidetes bacterium]|nr:T9SS type A sorting domain-containing protein [Bacteroidota bacterium]